MAAKSIVLVILVLLLFRIQPVQSPQEPISSPCNNSTIGSSDVKDDPCKNHTIVCSAMVSSKDMLIPWFSFVVSFMILLCPALRIKDLKPNPRTGPQTLYCWFLYIGCWGYISWIFYLYKCYHPRYSAFPILLTCCFGFFIHATLSYFATLKTSAAGEQRPGFIVGFTLLFLVLGWIWRDTQVIGWIGVALSVLSHFCRIASTEYYAKINWYLFFASIVGSVNGFLWLIHPQLCISREFKVGSYIIGCLRGLEAFLWLSRSIANMLSSIEGKTIEPRATVQLHLR